MNRSGARPLPQRTLGRSGITVPAIGIGCWAIGGPDCNLGMPMGWASGAGETAAISGLETAWELGARLYDTADVYGHGRSERRLGSLVRQVPREQIVLTSKVGYRRPSASVCSRTRTGAPRRGRSHATAGRVRAS
jgi:methylglyoxal reductase